MKEPRAAPGRGGRARFERSNGEDPGPSERGPEILQPFLRNCGRCRLPLATGTQNGESRNQGPDRNGVPHGELLERPHPLYSLSGPESARVALMGDPSARRYGTLPIQMYRESGGKGKRGTESRLVTAT